MRTEPSHFRAISVCLALLAAFGFFTLFASPAVAQSDAQFQPVTNPARILQAIDPANRAVLTGNTYYLARPQYDAGAAPATLPMDRMLLLLRRSSGQEAALEQLLQDQQNSASPNYHNWLTPEQFGAQFGPAAQDIQTVVSWLQSQGFTVNRISNGATVIEFSGTAGQVQSAFGTAIHKYEVNGEEHWANSSDPSIPAALAPVVAGFDTLHNFPRKAMHVVSGVYSRDRSTGRTKLVRSATTAMPAWNLGCGQNGATCYFLGPYDFAAIYNVQPLWSASPAVDGTGQSIAVIGESDVDVKDIEGFQSLFGLPAKDPAIVVDGPDPGIVQGDETESDLDLEWSGAVAKGATVKFIIAATTNTTLGVDLAAQHAVDENIAPIISESYGICEAALGTSGNAFLNALWQQAAAQGITAILASGDGGSAGCDNHDAVPPAPAEFGLQISGFASTPYNVAVGGTDFNDLGATSTYWNPTNTAITQASAKGYIPEVPWNDTCTSQALAFYDFVGTALDNCNNSQLLNIVVWTVGGSGGKSSCTTGDGQHITSCSGGYTKPTWQSGKGVPADGKRDIPDVALFASSGFFTGSAYIVCEADITDATYCSDSNLEFLGVGGTSASAPSFAGIMAMVDQKTAARQGNANYILYSLAAQSGASCASAGAPASTCVFYDVATGTNAMPCDATAPQPVNCGTPGSAGIGILTGYNASAGYDETTGLGSVNAANLVKSWSTFSVALKPSTTTLALSPTSSIVHGAPVNVTVGVSAVSPATGTPTGLVSLLSTSALDPGVTSLTLTAGAFSGSTEVLPGGTYSVTAHYPGDSSFAGSTSSPVSITVTPEASKVAVSAITQNSQGVISSFTSGAYGFAPIYLRADVSGNSGNGFPSGNVTFKDNGNAIGSGLTLSLNSQGNALPTNPSYTFAPGSHSISASYAGDASFNASASTVPATFTISQASTAAAAPSTGGPTVILGSPAPLSASVTATSCGKLPTGTITFLDGATQLGTPQTVQASSFANCTVTATASLSTAAFTLGANSISYKYSGDTNYASTTSSVTPLDAQIATTTTASANPMTIQQGQNITLTAKVAQNQTGGPGPTGTVQFVGIGVGPATLTNGQAQTTTNTLTAGTDQITAQYSGDSNYAASSGSLSVVVSPGPDFGVTFAPAAVTVTSPGASASTVITVNGTNGFNSSVTFSATCAGLPSESACSFSSATVATGATTTLTISTTAASRLAPSNGPSGGPGIPALRRISDLAAQVTPHPAGLLLLLAMFALVSTQLRRRHMRWIAPLALFALLVVCAACGGGGGGSTPPTNPGTPVVSNQTITVSATSGGTTPVTHTFTFTLSVN
ncbi:MAG: Ig-like domain repeat protein [Candidatus Acidiferrales bacterium]